MASAIRSFMLPVGFSFSSFSRMRAPFPGTILRNAISEVLPMQSRMLCCTVFHDAREFLTADPPTARLRRDR